MCNLPNIFHAFFDCKVESYHMDNYRNKACLPDYASISPNLISYKFRVETTVTIASITTHLYAIGTLLAMFPWEKTKFQDGKWGFKLLCATPVIPHGKEPIEHHKTHTRMKNPKAKVIFNIAVPCLRIRYKTTFLHQFAFDCASRGFHVYHDVWSP